VQLSQAGDGVRRELSWPQLAEKIRLVSPYRYRYFFNYCTFSYSMAWWGWQEWERELDWMALHGVNLALAIVGAEAVWPKVLRRFGFGEDEIFKYLPGPAYLPWFHMGNLEGHGGPLSPAWLDRQVELGQRILARMRELGIEPVLQGFYGMVPSQLRLKRPAARVVPTGNWNGTTRPSLLDPTDPLFAEMAEAYYEEQERLFGPARFFGGDPFHEGGDPGQLDVTAGGRAIQQAMQAAHPGSIWVLQGWQENPSEALLRGLDPLHTLILDLFCETVSVCETRGGFKSIPWVWGAVLNFGGNTPSHGKLDLIARKLSQAAHRSNPPAPCGLGGLMEGFHSNPVNWELLFELAWLPEPFDLAAWLADYAHARYGKTDRHVEAAWRVFSETIYAQPGAAEPLVCAQPALGLDRVTTWGSAQLAYEPARLEQAAGLFLEAADALGGVDTYRYDLVDITRQVLENRAQSLYHQVVAAFEHQKRADFDASCHDFLDLIDDLDRLLASRPEFLLGRWLTAARAMAADDREADRFEGNARMLLTTWGERAAAIEGGVNDYAYREWAGSIKGYYRPRWEMFFTDLRARLEGSPRQEIDWFAWERGWVDRRDTFPQEPDGDAVAIARQLHEKYGFQASDK
jgi:alpha-N-acetylglucosaminidase